MDGQTLSLAFALCCFGAAAGVVATFWITRDKEAAQFVCGCGHSVAMHELNGGQFPDEDRCHADLRRPVYANAGDQQGVQVGWQYVACRCRHYTGVSPFEED